VYLKHCKEAKYSRLIKNLHSKTALTAKRLKKNQQDQKSPTAKSQTGPKKSQEIAIE